MRCERDRRAADDRRRDANTTLGNRHRRIFANNRGLRLVPSESRVQGPVRPVYKDDGNSSSRDAVVVQASPAGGVLPIWGRPVRGRYQTGSG